MWFLDIVEAYAGRAYQWTAEEKFAIVLETATLSKVEVSEYLEKCRK